jgi:saccharopine dehydrogenase-like NADP-dependent oxidoreductase
VAGEPAAPGSYRVLVLGGTGVFGTLLCRRLARVPAIGVIVAARDGERAARLAQSLPAAEAAAVDLHRDLPAALLRLRPALVIHCAGPFQEQEYAVARACVAERIAYLDLADGRRFVADITALDAEARGAGVAVVSGASSVPAISAAAVRALSADLATLERIAVAILPGNRAPRGAAVVAAILGQAGQRISVREQGRQKIRYGWHDLRRIAVPGLGRRWASVVDVPDLEVFPARWPGLRTSTFHAGLELSLLHLGL